MGSSKRSKKSLFSKTKIWNCFFRFIYTWKALNHSILINEAKVMRSFCFLESLSTYVYLLFFFRYVLQFQMMWNFSTCSQLDLKNESKEAPPFLTFFHTNVSLWSAAAQFFTGQKNGFLWIQMLISCNPCGRNFWNFFHMFSSQYTTRSYGYMRWKTFFF